MKLKYIILVMSIVLGTSCSNDDDNSLPPDETQGLLKVTEFTNDTHTIEMYTETGKFYTGYNEVSFRIKNNADNSFIETATINWMPVMQMETKSHSCPMSSITKVSGKRYMYEGLIIYQMTAMDGSGWSIKFEYTINDKAYIMENTITVLQSKRQNVTTAMGTDGVKYVLALLEPRAPKIAINELKIGLYKMENMMSFPIVENYSIAMDPRMPSMGNHSSPNNQDLSYNTEDRMYYGKVSLTMSGYWVLNLKLKDSQGTVLKGEDVTETNIQSSLYLELEF